MTTLDIDNLLERYDAKKYLDIAKELKPCGMEYYSALSTAKSMIEVVEKKMIKLVENSKI